MCPFSFLVLSLERDGVMLELFVGVSLYLRFFFGQRLKGFVVDAVLVRGVVRGV